MIIGLAGRAGSGKSTCAKFLEERYGFVRFSLADPLKQLAKKVFHFSDAQLYGTQAEKEAVDPRYGFSPRQALITLGAEARVEIGEDIWIAACLDRIYRSKATRCVIDDVRYYNEAFLLKDSPRHHGYVIKLECPNADTLVDPNAPSECSVDRISTHLLTTVIKEPRGGRLLEVFGTVVETLFSHREASEKQMEARV